MCRLEEVIKRENHCLNAAMQLVLPALDKPLCKPLPASFLFYHTIAVTMDTVSVYQ